MAWSSLQVGIVKHCNLSDDCDMADAQIHGVVQAAFSTFDDRVINEVAAAAKRCADLTEERRSLQRQLEDATRHLQTCLRQEGLDGAAVPPVGRTITLSISRAVEATAGSAWRCINATEVDAKSPNTQFWRIAVAATKVKLDNVCPQQSHAFQRMVGLVSTAYSTACGSPLAGSRQQVEGHTTLSHRAHPPAATAAALGFFVPEPPRQRSHCKQVTRMLRPLSRTVRPACGVEFSLGCSQAGGGGGGATPPAGTGQQQDGGAARGPRGVKRRQGRGGGGGGGQAALALPTIGVVSRPATRGGVGAVAAEAEAAAAVSAAAAVPQPAGGGVALQGEELPRLHRGLANTPNHATPRPRWAQRCGHDGAVPISARAVRKCHRMANPRAAKLAAQRAAVPCSSRGE